MDHADFPWRPLGLLLVAKGLVTEAQLELALAEQRRSGRLLGQILVGSGYVTGLALAQALTEQHGVELRPTEDGDGVLPVSREQPTTDPAPQLRGETQARAWHPLGRILVTKEFVSEAELESALAEQKEQPHRRLGEILVARGWLTGSALAVAVAEQHGLDIGAEEDLDAGLETVIRPTSPSEPSYRVREVVYEPAYQLGAILYESTSFLEAADFACEFVEARRPRALEIQKADSNTCETVWTYSETRAAAASASQKSLVQTFGFDPMRWDTRGQFDSSTKKP